MNGYGLDHEPPFPTFSTSQKIGLRPARVGSSQLKYGFRPRITLLIRAMWAYLANLKPNIFQVFLSNPGYFSIFLEAPCGFHGLGISWIWARLTYPRRGNNHQEWGFK